MGYNQELRRQIAEKKLAESIPVINELSLIHPYYNDASRLALQLEIWKTWSPRVCKTVNITLIDDGSPKPLILSDENKQMLKDKGLKLSVYRILKDLKYNTPGALNLGALVSPSPWILIMDSDCFFDAENIEKLMDYKPFISKIVKFPRKRYGNPQIEDLKTNRYLPCTMLMHKQVFTSIGGFDEDFTGAYSGGYGFFDNEFDGRAIIKGFWSEKYHVVQDIIAGEWMPSVYGTAPVQRTENHHIINKHLMYKKYNKEIPQNKQILQFPWEQVYTNWL